MATNTKDLPLFSKELILSYVFTLVAAGLATGSQFFLPKQVPLWYSLAILEQQLVPKIYLAIFPLSMVLICLSHTAIINSLRQMDTSIVKIFSFGTTLVAFLILIGLVHIIYIFL